MWPCSEKVEFWSIEPTTRVRWGNGEVVCGQNICYHVAAFVIPFNLICNQTMFWKSWTWPFERTPRLGGSGVSGKILATMWLYFWFHLIWYATWLCSEKLNFDLLTHPLSSQGWDTGLRSKISFDMFHFYCTSVCMGFSAKKMSTDWVIAKFIYMTFDPTKGVRGLGKSLITVMLI